jgi:hypothetical protein
MREKELYPMLIKNDFRLPRVDELPANLALAVVGRALAEIYRRDLERPLPDSLLRIVQQIEEHESSAGRP